MRRVLARAAGVRTVTRSAFAVALVLLAASCAGGSEIAGDRRVVGDVNVAFSITPARVEAGRSVRFVLRLTNNGGTPERLDFASGQLYDFWVTEGAEEIWRWSDDRSFTQSLEQRTIATQDSLTLEETWESGGTGTYVAHGLLKARGYDRPLTGELIVGG